MCGQVEILLTVHNLDRILKGQFEVNHLQVTFVFSLFLKKRENIWKDSIISADSAKSKHDLHVMKSPEKEIGIGNQTIKFPFVFVRNS